MDAKWGWMESICSGDFAKSIEEKSFISLSKCSEGVTASKV